MSCPACGASVIEGARFCAACGHALRARTDERRVVTVLFADLVGFTRLSETRDPEQVKNLVDECFARLAADVTTFGGRVDKILGDGLLALFGAPVAHEDDAERGVRAALQMQRTLDDWSRDLVVDVRMRVGVNTGEVLVGALRAGGDYTAMGDVVNSASRLQSSAAPGEVIIGPLTYASTRDVVRTQPLGPLYARGRDEPIEAWRVVEAVGLPGYRPVRRRAPLVGRDAEIGMLRHALQNAVSRRRPHMALVVAEAGMGTSRLAEEVATLARRAYSATVLDGRCVPYGEANVWWPVAEALRQACGIAVTDPADVSASKCLTAVADIAGISPDHAEARRLADGLLYLMGYDVSLRDVDPSRARDEAVRSLHVCLEGMGRRGPVVLCLSDLHWADDLVLELIDRLLERLRSLPLLVIATARPELGERWTPKAGRHNLVVVNLDLLDRPATEALLSTLLESPPDPQLRDMLIERSGGNPFFLEELVSLVTQGLATGTDGERRFRELPETLRGLVAARLDSLAPYERAVLDDAAVVGRSGRLDVLEALADARGAENVKLALDALVSRELLLIERRRWTFRSDVVREVAYGMLTKADRARRHASLALWQEQRFKQTGREAEFLELVAHHFARAAELSAELGPMDGVPADIGDRALSALERTAARAEWRELPVAVHLLGHALRLVADGDAERRWRLLLRRARARISGSHDLAGARADATTVMHEAESVEHRAALAGALTVLGEVEKDEGEIAASAATLERAVALWREAGDNQGTAEALRALGMTNLFRGDLDVARASVDEAHALFVDIGDRRGEAWALQNLAWIAFGRGDPAQADERLGESAKLFEAIGDRGGHGWAIGLLGWVRLSQGRFQEAEALAEEILNSTREMGNRWGEAMMLALLGHVRLWQGRTREAVDRSREALVLFRSFGDHWGEARALQPLARGLVAAGAVADALAASAEAIEIARSVPDPSVGFMARHTAASVAVMVGDPDGALDLLGPEPYDSARAWAAVALLQLGRVKEAERCLDSDAPVRDELRPKLDPLVTAVRALVHAACGRPEDAVAAGDPALASAHATYSDRSLAAVARGLAFARMGRAAESHESFANAMQIVGTTGDVLGRLVARLAEGHALRHVGASEWTAVLSEARARLAEIDVAPTPWETAFAVALGDNPYAVVDPIRVRVRPADPDTPSEGV